MTTTGRAIAGWEKALHAHPERLGFLVEERGLSLDTIRGAHVGWDGERYTIPVSTPEGKVVNVRRYAPSPATDKVVSLPGRGKPRLYAPTEPPSADAPVLILEGELDCLKAVEEVGEDWWCVTSTGGASNPPPQQDLSALEGRDVVVVYDCDDAGRKGALKVAARVEGIAASVRVVDLGLRDSEDLTDWFCTYGRDVDGFKALLSAAPFYSGGDLVPRERARVLVERAVGRTDELGSRNAACFWLACQLRDSRYTKADAEASAREFASAVARDKADPFTVTEALATVASAYAERPREPALRPAERPGERFPLIGPSALADRVPPMEWLIRGVWPLGSYGPWGGPKKSLKTYIALGFALALAAGRPALNNDDWAVPEARPVIYYGGEGGRRMYQARLQRIARDLYGIEDISELPFYLVTDVGPFDGPEFREALRRNLAEVADKHGQVGLVVLDSLYNFHPADIDVSNLYDRGRLLGGLSAPLVEDQIAVWVVDHFNKTGSGIDLDRLAQAGMAAWADSWVLFDHARDPDVANGSFSISTGIGSRQWGGDEWTLHVDIGPFDTDTGVYPNALKVETVKGMSARRGAGGGSGTTDSDINASILAFIDANPDQTKAAVVTGVMEECGVGRDRVQRSFSALTADSQIESTRRPRTEGSREVSREVWRLPVHKVQRATRPAPVKLPRSASPKRNPTGNPTRPRQKVGESR